MNQQDKIEMAVNKIELALRAALGKQLDEQMYLVFAIVVRKMLTSDYSDTTVTKADGVIRHVTIENFMEQLTPAEQKTFFRNLLLLEDNKEIPGRFSVEHRIDLKVAKKDQDAFWGQSFLSMLERLSITQEAFCERLEQDLAVEYHDSFNRVVNYSEIAKVFMDQHMSYEHYLYCAKLVGFTHVKIELI